MKTSGITFLLVAALMQPSCSLYHPKEPVAKGAPGKVQNAPLFEWHGSGVAGPARVTINLSEQKAHIYKGGQQVGWTYVATGVEEHRTPTGHFSIMEKIADKHSNIWGIIVDGSGSTVNGNAHNGVSPVPGGGHFVGAPMPHWMRLTSYGVGMHGGPIPHPGSPASHGCIRLPYSMATYLFESLPEGTPVTIVN